MDIRTTKRITNSDELKAHMRDLEHQLAIDERQLKKDVREVYQSLHLKNMVKNAFKEMKESPQVRNGLIATGATLGMRLLVDKVLFRKNRSIKSFLINEGVKKVLGFFISKNKDTILKKAGL
jgi:hypothetical protein